MQHFHHPDAFPRPLAIALSRQAEPAWGEPRHLGGTVDEAGKTTGIVVYSRALVFVERDVPWGYAFTELRALSLRANTIACTVAPSNDAYDWGDRATHGPVHHPPRAVDPALLEVLSAQLVARGQSWDGLLVRALTRFLDTLGTPAEATAWRGRTAGSRRAELQVVLDALFPVGLMAGRDGAHTPVDPWSLLPSLFACSADALAVDANTLLSQGLASRGDALLDLAEVAMQVSGHHRFLATLLPALLHPSLPAAWRELVAAHVTRASAVDMLDALLLAQQHRETLGEKWHPALDVLALLSPMLANHRPALRSPMAPVDLAQVQGLLTALPADMIPQETADLMVIWMLDAALRDGQADLGPLLEHMEARCAGGVSQEALLCLLAASTVLASRQGGERQVQDLIGRLLEKAQGTLPDHPYHQLYRRCMVRIVPALNATPPPPFIGATVAPEARAHLTGALTALGAAPGCVPMFPQHLTLFHRDLPELQAALERAAPREGIRDDAPARKHRLLPWVIAAAAVLLPMTWMAGQLLGPCGAGFGALIAGWSRDESYECLGPVGDVLLTVHSLLYVVILLGGWAWANSRGARFTTGLAIGALGAVAYCGLLWLLGSAAAALLG